MQILKNLMLSLAKMAKLLVVMLLLTVYSVSANEEASVYEEETTVASPNDEDILRGPFELIFIGAFIYIIGFVITGYCLANSWSVLCECFAALRKKCAGYREANSNSNQPSIVSNAIRNLPYAPWPVVEKDKKGHSNPIMYNV